MADSQRKTANLFDSDDSETGYLDNRGLVMAGSDAIRTSNYIPVLPNTTYSLNATGSGRIKAFKQNKTVVSYASYNDYGISLTTDNTFTTSSDTYFIRFSFQPANLPIMFNTGSTSLPYEPYGWLHSLRKLTTATEAIENPLYSDGTAITAYTLKGNTVQNGTPSPSNPVDVNGVGEKTANLFDDTNIINIPTLGDRYGVELPSGTYSIYNDTGNNVYYGTNDWTGRQLACSPHSTATVQLNVDSGVGGFFIALNSASQGGCTIVEGSTPPDHYIPYGYEIPISSGGQTIDIYIGDLPLLKSLDGTAVDEISNGTLTRRVDSDGSVLPAPITTQITMPSIPTTDGVNSITVDTTVQPSEFSATWTGWHDANVKEWDGSDWQ